MSSRRYLRFVVACVALLVGGVPALSEAQTGGISGTVRAGGSVQAGYNVAVYDSAESLVATSPGTSSLGAFSVSGLAPGTYYAFAYTGNITPYVNELYPNTPCVGNNARPFGNYCRINTGTPIAVSAGAQTSGIDFDLDVAGSIQGRILADGSTGYTAGGGTAFASILVDDGTTFAAVATSAATSTNGVFQLARLPAGTYYVWAGNVTGGAASGYVAELNGDIACASNPVPVSGTGCALANATPLAVIAGGTSTANFDLARGGAISGTILGGGAPRSNLFAGAVLVGGGTQSSPSASGSQSTGAYLVRGLAPGQYTMTGGGFGYQSDLPPTVVSVVAGSITPGVNFDLQPSVPVITVPLNGRGVLAGQSVTLSVTATGAAPLSYQWYTGVAGDTSNPLSGATSRDFVVPPLPFGSISYWVRVSNGLGSADSFTASVGVAVSTQGAIAGTVASGGQPVANSRVSVYSTAETLVQVAEPTSASGAYSLTLPAGNYYVHAGAAPVGGNVTGQSIPVTGYPYTDVLYPNIPCVGGASSVGAHCRIASGTLVTVTAGAITTADFDVPVGGQITGTLTVAGAPPNSGPGTAVTVYVDGPTIGAGTATGIVNPDGTFVVGRLPAGQYRVAASSVNVTAELWDDVACPPTGCRTTVAPPIAVASGATTPGKDFDLILQSVVITAQPRSQVVDAGQSATLSVAASGKAPFTYEWFLGRTGDASNPIAGATSSTYVTGPVNARAEYWVRVSNALGPASSATATVVVAPGSYGGLVGGSGGTITGGSIGQPVSLPLPRPGAGAPDAAGTVTAPAAPSSAAPASNARPASAKRKRAGGA